MSEAYRVKHYKDKRNLSKIGDIVGKSKPLVSIFPSSNKPAESRDLGWITVYEAKSRKQPTKKEVNLDTSPDQLEGYESEPTPPAPETDFINLKDIGYYSDQDLPHGYRAPTGLIPSAKRERLRKSKVREEVEELKRKSLQKALFEEEYLKKEIYKVQNPPKYLILNQRPKVKVLNQSKTSGDKGSELVAVLKREVDANFFPHYQVLTRDGKVKEYNLAHFDIGYQYLEHFEHLRLQHMTQFLDHQPFELTADKVEQVQNELMQAYPKSFAKEMCARCTLNFEITDRIECRIANSQQLLFQCPAIHLEPQPKLCGFCNFFNHHCIYMISSIQKLVMLDNKDRFNTANKLPLHCIKVYYHHNHTLHPDFSNHLYVPSLWLQHQLPQFEPNEHLCKQYKSQTVSGPQAIKLFTTYFEGLFENHQQQEDELSEEEEPKRRRDRNIEERGTEDVARELEDTEEPVEDALEPMELDTQAHVGMKEYIEMGPREDNNGNEEQEEMEQVEGISYINLQHKQRSFEDIHPEPTPNPAPHLIKPNISHTKIKSENAVINLEEDDNMELE